MNRQKTGIFLKHLRIEKCLSQEKLAELFNVSSRSVSRWETGSNMPDLDMLIKLADFYNVEIREIVDGERKRKNINQEQEETLRLIADYSKSKEKLLFKKIIAIIILGIFAWSATFSFYIYFTNSAQGSVFLLVSETIALLLYGICMLCVKSNRSVNSLMNVIIGAVTAVIISNFSLVCVFFSTGSYKNYGLMGAYYSLLTLLVIFIISAIITSVINKKSRE